LQIQSRLVRSGPHGDDFLGGVVFAILSLDFSAEWQQGERP